MTVPRPVILSVEDLSVRYRMPRQRLFETPRWLTAVDRVGFTVRAGASLGVVGESGSGKSTTARAVMALERPSAGRVMLFDQDVGAISPAALRQLRPRFQMIFQDPYASLDPRYSVERVVTEPIHGMDRAEARERAAAAMADVGLGAADLRKYPNQFSGGQRQRIAIARALVTRPALIVADEAVSALDVSVQAQVLNLLRDLQAEHGIAYLFISHDLAVVEYLCEEIIVLFRGAIVESGRTVEVLRAAAHPYTQELIAAMPRLGARPCRARCAATRPDGSPPSQCASSWCSGASRPPSAASGRPAPSTLRRRPRASRSSYRTPCPMASRSSW